MPVYQYEDKFYDLPDGLTNEQAIARIQSHLGQSAAVSQPKELTAGQKTYQSARDILAPTVEALSSVAGGALGAPLGPLGMVGGAGLGYGIGKEAMQNLDVLMGVRQPRQGLMQMAEPLQNILEGATYEAGGRVAVPLLAKGAGKLMDIVSPSMNAAQLKASQIAREALGKDLPAVLDTLKNTKPGASIAEVTASLQNPTWQALIQNALERDPQFLRKINLFGEEESLKALSKLAGGGNAAETRQILENAKTALTTTTTPMREAALNRANLGQAVADYEATAGKLSNEAATEVQRVRDLIKAGNLAEASARLDLIKRGLPVGFTKYTYKNELAEKAFGEWSDKAAQASLDLGQGARFAQSAADALRNVGIKPLEGNKLAQRISQIADNPSFAGDDVLIGAVNNVADDIAKWTNGGGVIDARALDAIRKNSVNAAIQKLRPGMDATSQRNLASKVLTDIKPMLVDAVEESGGSGYRKYLDDYAQGMQKIAERKLSAEGLRLWKTNKDEFVKLVMNESPETVEKILGPGRYNIASELADETLGILNQQAQKRLTQLSVADQASEGQKALSELVKQQTSVIRLPSFLSFWASAGNKAISEFEKAVGKDTMDILTQAMKSPEGASNLLQNLPSVERNKVLNLLANPSQWSSKAGLAGTAGIRETAKAMTQEE
jgi:tetratricopeptide (TPR) repeat protein